MSSLWVMHLCSHCHLVLSLLLLLCHQVLKITSLAEKLISSLAEVGLLELSTKQMRIVASNCKQGFTSPVTCQALFQMRKLHYRDTV